MVITRFLTSISLSLLSLILLIQYPLSTTFPIGGDTTRYITRAEAVWQQINQNNYPEAFQKLRSNSRYPGAILIVLASKIIPMSWPDRFIWLITLGHLATASTLAFITYKLTKSHLAAALAFFIWCLNLTTTTRHTEDATLAQLLSYPPLLLMIYNLSQGKLIFGLLLLSFATLLHPVSGFIGLLLLLCSLPFILKKTTFRRLILLAGVPALALLTLILWAQKGILSQNLAGDEIASLGDLANSAVGFFALLIPLSALAVLSQKTRAGLLSILFLILSTALTFNHWIIEEAIFPFRFQAYLILAITLISAEAFSIIYRQSTAPKLIAISLIILSGSLGAKAWHQNAQVFKFYESPANYARLHPDEQAAIAWSDTHLPQGSVITSTQTNRHSEWIPILSHHAWQPIQNEIPPSATHLFLFLNREKPTETIPNLETDWEPIFSNQGTVVYARI